MTYRGVSALLTRAHRGGYVFGEDRYEGRPATRGAVTHAFRVSMKRLGIKDASHHTLRHTGASVMLAEGASIRAVQEIGGWTSLRMLERYTHPTDAEKRRAVEISSQLTRKVGTKTGAVTKVARLSEGLRARKLLKLWTLEWRPNGVRTRVVALGGPCIPRLRRPAVPLGRPVLERRSL